MNSIDHNYQVANDIALKAGYIKRNYLAPSENRAEYIKYRVLRPILKVYYKITTHKYGKESPWLTPASIEFLGKVLNKDMRGLEYGSGRSTLFISEKIGNLISVEHDRSWYSHVTTILHEKEIENVEYHLFPSSQPETKVEIEIRNNASFVFELNNFEKYFDFILDQPDDHFDFILIDGRARVECCARAVEKLKSGGIFILDNSERLRYKPVHTMLDSWKQVFTTTGLTDTTIWFKP